MKYIKYNLIHALINILNIFLFITQIYSFSENLKYPAYIKHSLLGQISLSQSPRQEIFWAPAGFENAEKSVSNSIRCSTLTWYNLYFFTNKSLLYRFH